MNASVSNASAPSVPPIIGPKEGLDETTLDVLPAAMEEGIVVTDITCVEEKTCVEENTCVEETTCVEGKMSVEENMSVEEGGGASVTAKKSRKMVWFGSSEMMVITNVWDTGVNSFDWNNRT